MRASIALLMLLLASLSLHAQNKPLLYDVDVLPQSLLSNPGAKINFSSHFGIPFLSQIQITVGSTGVTLFDVFNDENSDVNLRVGEAIENLTPKDYFALNQQMEILSLGFKLNKRDYLSMGVYQELDVFAYFPKDLAVLANEGNSQYLNKVFDFSQAAFTAELLNVYHIGLNRKINKRLTVGMRGKIYSGIMNVESVANTGTFVTSESPLGPNVYRHSAQNLDILVNTAGIASLDGKEVPQALAEVAKRAFLAGNLGLGLDVGFTYMLKNKYKITAAAEDIGFVAHKKGVENYQYSGSYETDGIDPLFPNNRSVPYWDLFEDELDENLQDTTRMDNYVTWRPLKLHTSMQIGFGRALLPCNYHEVSRLRYKNLVGLQISSVNRPKGMEYAVTGYFDRKINLNNRLRFAYTVDRYSATKLGLMFSSTFNNFNVYLAANNLLAFPNLAKANSASLQLGMQFVFGRL